MTSVKKIKKLNVSKILNRMTEAKISKKRLHEQTGVAVTTINAVLEGSDTRISTLTLIADCLGLRISYLFDEDDNISTTATDHSAAAINGNAVTINNSPEVDKKLIEKLMAENELLNRLLEEKERFITHLLGNYASK